MGALAYDSGFPAARVPDALCNSRTLAPLAEGFLDVCGRFMLPVTNGAADGGKGEVVTSSAGVAELVDALDLGSSGASRGGSNPSARTSAEPSGVV